MLAQIVVPADAAALFQQIKLWFRELIDQGNNPIMKVICEYVITYQTGPG